MSDNEAGYGLVMPFVTVASKGGPHDDASYVSGWAMGALDARLGAVMRQMSHEETVRDVDLPQADLIAMKHGYRIESRSSGVDGWVFCEFTTDLLDHPGGVS